MAVKLRGALPRRGDLNGLAALDDAEIQPGTLVAVVALLDAASVTAYSDRRDVVLQVREIEPVSGPESASVDYILRRARDTRTGATPLPFDEESGQAVCS